MRLEVSGYERGTLKTLEAGDASVGVVVVSGFGYGQDRESGVCGQGALYLDGALVGSHYQVPNELNLYQTLAEALALKSETPWVERQAHAWWSLQRIQEAPATVAEYDSRTVEMYAKAVREEAIAAVSSDYAPTVPWQEGQLVSQVFGLSGGDLAGFDRWYQSWVKKRQLFSVNEETQAVIREMNSLRSSRKSKTSSYVELDMTLRQRWLAYLGEVWDVRKPLDPVARRARLT